MCKSPGALKIEASGDFFVARDVIVMLDFVIVHVIHIFFDTVGPSYQR